MPAKEMRRGDAAGRRKPARFAWRLLAAVLSAMAVAVLGGVFVVYALWPRWPEAAPVADVPHLPIVIDPSHGTGRRDSVAPMTKAAIAAGADAVMVEVHDDPERALSDGAQSLSLDAFDALMKEASLVAEACGRPFELPRVLPFAGRAQGAGA